MRTIGPETAADRAQREWFAEQEKKNFERLEEGAKTITQLVTGLYGVLFAVLAFDDKRTYLQRFSVQVLGTATLIAFFVALLAALVAVYPWLTSYQENNLSDMARKQSTILHRKALGVSIALCAFLVGILCLGGVIIAVLWQI